MLHIHTLDARSPRVTHRATLTLAKVFLSVAPDHFERVEDVVVGLERLIFVLTNRLRMLIGLSKVGRSHC